MPKGPKGQKRPADVIGNAVRVMRIATGEATSEIPLDGSGEDEADGPLVEIKVNGVSGDVRIERARSQAVALES